jgi:hypothetical protein
MADYYEYHSDKNSSDTIGQAISFGIHWVQLLEWIYGSSGIERNTKGGTING